MSEENNKYKIWDKGIEVDQLIESFTVGKDREMDLYLAPFDVLGSMAHVRMLTSIGLLTQDEMVQILAELRKIYSTTLDGSFIIEEGVEDVHSQVELMLTRTLGDIGKKIHSGRSRNDQVLVDLKLFIRSELEKTVKLANQLFELLIQQADRYKDILLPGYTHLQVAMPSSFGLWFSAYAESLADDMLVMQSAYGVANQNPLGSAAGYGSSFPLNRQMTTDLLGFASMNYNVVYAQMGRGKTEKIVSFAMANLASTLSKMAYDVCLFMSQNFGFVSLPDELTTGSSIMPHKKNPDVFELLRGHCNKLQTLPVQVSSIINNLPSGYFRDLQVVKEEFIPAFTTLQNCIEIAIYAISHINVNENILNDKRYDYLFSVEEVNRMVYEGVSFRDAYKEVGKTILDGKFVPNKNVNHTHEGSIGNLCLDKIREKMKNTLTKFEFEKAKQAFDSLLDENVKLS